MKEENEQGFLSHKFEDWSSEPIPNGWSKIQAALNEEPVRTRWAPFWMVIGLIVVAVSSLVWINNLKSVNPELVSAPELTRPKNPIVKPTGESVTIEPEALKPAISVLQAPAAVQTRPSKSVLSKTKNIGIEKDQSSNRNMAFAESPKEGGPQKSGSGRRKLAVLGSLKTDIQSTQKESLESEVENINDRSVILLSNPKTTVAHLPEKDSDMTGEKSGDSDVAKNQRMGEVKELLEEGSKPAGVNTGAENLISLENLVGRNSQLVLPEFIAEQNLVPVFVENRQPLSNSANKWTFSVGISGGYAPKSIEINQAQAVSRLSVSEGNTGSPSLFGNVGFTVQNEIKPWLRSFGAVKFGMMRNSISVTETTKSPTGFEMTTTDSINYSMTPVWAKSSGNIRQDLLFSTLEFGLNPILLPSRQSGPFASVVVWISLFQKVANDVGHSLASFEDSKENVALSYRLGYQHVFSRNLRGEIFTSGMPDKLMANSKGLSIKPQLIGLGLHYILH